MGRGRKFSIAMAAALALRGARGWAAISFDPASTLRLTHDLDISQAGPSTIVNIGGGSGVIPKSRDLYPIKPYQIDSTLPFVGAANYSLALGSLGQVTNNTTASFTLATGSGVTQTDPSHLVPGASSLLYNVDLRWNVPSTGQFGPLANGFATLAMGGTVGAGGSAEVHINLNFVNGAGTALRTPWIVNKTYLGGASGATIAETFTTGRVLGSGTLAAGSALRIQGTVEFRASNDGAPTEIKPVRAEVGGTPPTGIFRRNPIGGGNWSDAASWERPTDPSDTGIVTSPSGVGYRALFYGTTGGSAAAIRTDTAIVLGTLDVDNTNDLSFVGNFGFDTLPGAGNAVMNVRGTRGQSGIFGQVVLLDSLDLITEGSTVTLNGLISGSGGMNKLGPGPLLLLTDNTYSGNTTVSEGLMLVNNTTGSGTGSGSVSILNGGTLGGRGTISGAVNVASGGIIDPGDATIQTLTVGGLTLNGGARVNLQVSSGFDRIHVTDANGLNLAGGAVISLKENIAEAAPGDYVIIDYEGNALSSISNLSLASQALGRNVASLVHDTVNKDVVLRLTAGPTWNFDGNGNWGTAANWTGSGVPTIVANLLGKITAARSIALMGDRRIHTLNIDNLNQYVIIPGTAGSDLLMADSTHLGNINVNSGNHTIAAPVVISGSTTINIDPSAVLNLTGGVAVTTGKSLTKEGDGTLIVSGTQSNAAGSELIVAAGQLNLNSNGGAGLALRVLAGTFEAPQVVLGANQDLAELTVDFAPNVAQGVDLNSPTTAGAFRQVRVFASDLDAARASIWNAVVNANQAGAINPEDGIFDSHLHANSRIGVKKMADHVLLRQTRIGDLNLDGLVTIADFIDLSSHFNQAGAWEEGDLNYDGAVTIADFIDLASNFNTSYAGESWPISEGDAAMLAGFAAAHGTSVPEPGMVWLTLGVLGCLRRRSRLRM